MRRNRCWFCGKRVLPWAPKERPPSMGVWHLACWQVRWLDPVIGDPAQQLAFLEEEGYGQSPEAKALRAAIEAKAADYNLPTVACERCGKMECDDPFCIEDRSVP